MAAKKARKPKGEAKTLPAKSLSQKQAAQIRGGYRVRGVHIKKATLGF